MKENENRKTVSVVEAGRILGLGRSAAYAAARSGELPVLRIGGKIIVPIVSLNKMLDGAEPSKAAR